MENMQDFMKEIEASMEGLQPGDLVEGRVASVLTDEVVVNFDYICDGIIPRADITKDRKVSLSDFFTVDDRIQALVVEVREGEGTVILSASKAAEQVAWKDFEDSMETGNVISVEISEAVKGGVSALYMGVRGFIPASRLGAKPPGELTEWVGRRIPVKVIELDQSKRKVVFSGRELAEAAESKQKDVLFQTLQIGEQRTGKVTRLADFGAFVDLGGVEGLIHISDLSWERVKHPSDVLKPGDTVQVQILKLDAAKGRIGLGLKSAGDDPWNGAAEYYQPGDIVEGTVVRMMPFGAFVEIEPGLEGLVHISEISETRIAKPHDALKLGQQVEVVVLKVDETEKRMSLSIRQAAEAEGEDYELPETEGEVTTSLGALLAQKLKGLQ